VGAGPAGSHAAYHLARSGARVALLEARELPRYKTCGGGIVWRTRQRLPIPLDGIARRECTQAQFQLMDGRFRHRVRRDVPIVSMVSRAEFDAALAAAARESGARLLERCSLRTLRSIDGGVEVGAGSRVLRARFVVAADGASGPTRRLAGWKKPLPRIPAIEWEAVPREPVAESDLHTARFFALGSSGYGWAFPKPGHLSLGALTTEPDAEGLRRGFAEMLRFAGIGELRTAERHGFVIPTLATRDDAAVSRGRVLLTGDAAGLVDPITWEGIGHACTSGRLAAEALLAAEGRSEEARGAYQVALEREVLSELRWARRFARLLYGPPRLRRALFALFGAELCEAMTRVVLGESSYRELVASAGAYARIAASPFRSGRKGPR